MCAAGQVVQLECVSSWVLSTHRKEGTSFVPLEAPIPYFKQNEIWMLGCKSGNLLVLFTAATGCFVTSCSLMQTLFHCSGC